MRALADRSRSLRRAAVSLLLATALYDSLARSGAFPPALIPTLPTVGRALIDGLLGGSLAAHTLYTLYRGLLGLGPAIAVGLPLGIPTGRSGAIEDFFLPLASALMPIPSLAWVPVFILWFGLGKCHRHRHRFLRLFPMLLNTWSGVRAVNPIWLRAGRAMGAGARSLSSITPALRGQCVDV